MAGKIIIHIDPQLADLIPDYIAHKKKDLLIIRELLKKTLFDDIRVLGHKMKGGGSLYNLELITALGGKIEHAAMDMDTNAIEEALTELEDFFERLEVI